MCEVDKMSTKVKVRIANPAGNITVFVLSPLDRTEYAKAANQLMEMEQFHAEQVGFVEMREDGNLRLQMMGGEFCGNATRSFGFLKSLLDETHPQYVDVEVSGSSDILTVEVNHERGTSRTSMPLPECIKEVEVPGYGSYPVVVFDGIMHMIAKGPQKSEGFVKAAMDAVRAQGKCDAYGIMFLEPSGDGMEKCYRMTPVVLVVETGSLVWESSCGSGSMACAVYLSDRKEDGHYVYVLRQPGGLIEASVVRTDGRAVQCKMGGPVTISEEMEVEIER